MTNYYRNVAESQYADPVANKFVSGKLTADKLNAQFTSIDAGARNDSVFVADEFGINNGFPVLAWQNVGRIKLEGSGTQADPFLIGTADELMFAANQSNSTDAETNYKYCGNYNGKGKVYYKITADIDMSGYDFPGFGRSDLSSVGNMGGNGRGFYGEIYGDGHVIKNLTINAANASINAPLGFICRTWNSTVTDLGLENVKINSGTRIGGFVGYAVSSVTLQSCYVKGFNGTGTEKTGALLGFNNSESTKCYFINCYSLDVTGGRGIIDYNGANVNVAKTVADFTNCYTSAFNNFQAGTTTYNSFYYNVAPNSYVQAGASTTAGKLSADMLQAEATNLKTGDHIRTDCNFVADEFGINNGFPVLAWQNRGFVKPGFTADSTEVIAAEDENGYPSFIVYGWLNNFNTDATGMEFGMKISDGEDLEEYLPAKVKVGEGEEVTYVPMTPVANGQFAIRVYIKGLTTNTAYTMTPYIGTAGNYTYGDASDEYTVTVD